MFTRETLENIMYLNALGQPMIIINSLEPAFELLDRRASIYSDRPRNIVGQEILCGGLFTPLMSYGDVFVFTFLIIPRDSSLIHSWRRHRRAEHEALTKSVIRDYHPTYRKEAIILASSILEKPEDSHRHLERCSASATLSILYDYPTLEDEHDKTITEIHAFINHVSADSAPGAYLVEYLPWMIHIPERQASKLSLVGIINKCDGTSDSQSGNEKE
jgi:hypothetical protein